MHGLHTHLHEHNVQISCSAAKTLLAAEVGPLFLDLCTPSGAMPFCSASFQGVALSFNSLLSGGCCAVPLDDFYGRAGAAFHARRMPSHQGHQVVHVSEER
eukprot:1147463-Pelagomonas_calceolata.AAC.4